MQTPCPDEINKSLEFVPVRRLGGCFLIASSPGFQDGWLDAAAGKRFRVDDYADEMTQLRYEEGRRVIFAARGAGLEIPHWPRGANPSRHLRSFFKRWLELGLYT